MIFKKTTLDNSVIIELPRSKDDRGYFSRLYCSDTLKSVTVNAIPESCCGEDAECCHNETVIYKIDSDYSSISFIFDSEQIAKIIPVELTIRSTGLLSADIFTLFSDIPSPPTLNSYLATIQSFLL